MAHTVYAVSEGAKFAGDSTLVVVCCNSCHITYAIPESLNRSMLRYRGDKANGWKTTCPMGHTWWYIGQSEEERLRERLEDERQRSQARRDLLKAEERSHAATRGHLTRQKRRAAAGTCPCCNRTFQQLARHMKGQHPEYVERAEGHLPADVPKPATLADAVHSFLGDGERRWAEIRDHLGLSSNQVAILISKLCGSGEIERVRYGVYKWRSN